MDLVSEKTLRERGGSVRIQLVSSRMPVAMLQLLPIIGKLMVRYSTRDAYLLCYSIGGGLGPPCPCTF